MLHIKKALPFPVEPLLLNGGGTQESNLPKEFLTPLNGFEDRAGHQRPTYLLILVKFVCMIQEKARWNLAFLNGALGEIRTPDTQIRSLVLYPAELQAHINNNVAEREGFEPSIPVSQYTRLAGERLRPTRPSLPVQKDLKLYLIRIINARFFWLRGAAG